MKKMKLFICLGIVLLSFGLIFFVILMASIKWDFKGLNNKQYEIKTYEISETFDDITLSSKTSDIEIVKTNNVCKIECYENEKITYSITLDDNMLKIEEIDSRKWYDYIGFNFEKRKITLYLPKKLYNSIKLQNTTGNIALEDDLIFNDIYIYTTTGNVNCMANSKNQIEIKATTGKLQLDNLDAKMINLKSTTGNIELNKINATNINIEVTTGDLKLNNVDATDIYSIGTTGNINLDNTLCHTYLALERTTGNIRINKSDSLSIYIKTSTGNIKGNILTDKDFIVKTKTGKIDVPVSKGTNKCELTTSTGNIIISITK